MCGIAGIVPGNRSSFSDGDLEQRIGVMADALLKRGPDDRGVYVASDRSIAMANRRLAIQDLSPAGHMPMSDTSQKLWVTYNGELYNVGDLRPELEALGYRFRSHGDTEVLLYGYAAWGTDVFTRLRGMFSCAIYDTRHAPQVILARDPLGIKPLCYAWTGGQLVFASECRGVLSSGLVSREISPSGLVAYLEFGSVPAPLTIYRDIRALEAGHYLTVSWSGGAACLSEPIRYWGLPGEGEDGSVRLPYPAAVDHVRSVLLDSVRRHLISDVPLGVFLSGGVDSGALVALMRAADPGGTIRTCSVVFDEPAYDESLYAQQVARHFETEHHELRVTAADLGRGLHEIVAALDQPTNDGINTYVVSRAAREAELTVALSGLGGDELFGGYPTFARLGPVLRAAKLVQSVPGALPFVAAGLNAWRPMHPGARLTGWLQVGRVEPTTSYLGLRGLFSPATVRSLVPSDVLRAAAGGLDLQGLIRRSAAINDAATPHQLASRLELTGYMRHQLLRDSDVMSMVHSLEVRVPYVDRVVVEKILRLRTTLPTGSAPKQLLRDAVPSLPAAVRLRRDKQGFSLPLAPWLRGPLRPQLGDMVHCAADELRAFLRPEACDRVLAAFDRGQVHWSRPWSLAALLTTKTM
jgi:asparagine synthase (glutamine-hydrolysing)